jgi:hypothetical protein
MKLWKGQNMRLKVVIAVTALIVMACICSNTPSASSNSSSSTPSIGNTRSNPYPFGTTVDIGSYMMAKVVSVVRPANKNVSDYNEFVATPEASKEYIQVNLEIQCTQSSNDKCSPILSQIKAVGADGIVHDPEILVDYPNSLNMNSEFFGGSTLKGNLVYLVPKEDSSVVLFSESLFGSPVYFAVK